MFSFLFFHLTKNFPYTMKIKNYNIFFFFFFFFFITCVNLLSEFTHLSLPNFFFFFFFFFFSFSFFFLFLPLYSTFIPTPLVVTPTGPFILLKFSRSISTGLFEIVGNALMERTVGFSIVSSPSLFSIGQ